ncbi:hypothetical protein Ndes2526B_g06582 [Nannochloris sp. 'desiccata']
MYLDEFAARLHQLEDPHTDVQTRHAADQWLTLFRDSPQAWSTAQSALSTGDPSLWPHAAQVLAYKSKRQLAQIPEIEQRMALLQTLSTALATLSSSHRPTTASSSSSFRAVTQGLCIAISNLILQLPTLPRPLEAMGSLLDQQVMLEFLTILPGEVDDAYSALHASIATDASEAAFLLKQRAGEWCIEVGSWLYNIVGSMVQSQPQLAAYLNSTRDSPLNTPPHTAAVLPPLFVPSISCFSAWIKWGGLFYMEEKHWEYMLRLSSTVLLCSGTDITTCSSDGISGVPISAAAAAVAAGVEALSEAIERPAPETHRIVLDICLRISQYITTVFPLGSSTHSNMPIRIGTTSSDQYRHLVKKAARGGGGSYDEEEEEEEEETGGVPAVYALGDVLEAIVDPSLSIQVESETEAAEAMRKDNGNPADFFSNFQLVSNRERIHFTSTVLSILLKYSQVPLPYQLSSAATAAILPTGIRNFRAQGEWLLWLCGEILEANTFIQQLYHFFQTESTRTSSEIALQALEVCFYAIHKGAAGAFSEDGDINLSAPSPPWLVPLLSLYAAAQKLDPCQRHLQQTTPTSPGLNTFHFNLLSSFATVAQPLMKALASMPDQCQGVMGLIFNQAESAIKATTTAPHSSRNNINSENFLGSPEDHQTGGTDNESVKEAAAQAVRAALSSPAQVQAMALAAGAVGAIDGMLAALTSDTSTVTSSSTNGPLLYTRRDPGARKASQQLIIALVRVLHTHDQHAAAAAQHVLRNRALQTLITIAAAAAAESAANTMHFNALHASLEDLMALLNALESHIDLMLGSSSEQHWPVVDATIKDAVTACLTAWPNILTALSQAAAAAAAAGSSASTSSHIATLSSIIYHDASQCLCSCIHLAPGSITPSLTPLLESLYSTFFLPGGHSMHRILCALLENTTFSLPDNSYNTLDSNSATKHNQITTLVTAIGSLLTHPMAQKLYSLGGGDADPDAACAVLTLATCLLRQASSNTQWSIVLTTPSNNNVPPIHASTATASGTQQPHLGGVVAPLVECVNLALRLSASNAACNHRGVCQRAIATLSAALVLMMDTSCTALHGPLLQLACSTSTTENTGYNAVVLDSMSSTVFNGGIIIMQGILLCLLSLHSLSFLPKIVNLMSDAAMLATACCNVPPNQGARDHLTIVTHASATLLQEWWNRAIVNLKREGTGVIGAGAVVAAAVHQESSLLNSLNWEPLVAAAAATAVGSNEKYGPGALESKRGVQRAVRQLADQIKKKHSSSSGG